jgi:hypothetical protein
VALPVVVGAIARATSAAGGAGSALSKAGSIAFNAQAAASGLGSLERAVLGLRENLNPTALSLKTLSFGIAFIQAPVVGAIKALGTLRETVGAVGAAASEFVRLASPVHVQLFNLAMDDFTASIGKILIPILESATKFVRMFADVTWALSGPLQNLMRAFKGPLDSVFKTLTEVFGAVVAAVTPAINVLAAIAKPFLKLGAILFQIVGFGVENFFSGLATALELLAAPIQVAAMLLGDFVDAMGNFVEGTLGWLRDVLGMDRPSIGGRSVGAAVRPATIGSVEDYGRKAQQAAFSLGGAASPDVTTAKYVQEIYNFLTKDLWNWLERKFGVTAIKDTVKDVGTAARDAGRYITDAATLKETRRRVGDFFDELF